MAFKCTMHCTHQGALSAKAKTPRIPEEEDEETEHLFVRVYRSSEKELLTDREREVYFLKKMANLGIGPGLYATFINGIPFSISPPIIEVAKVSTSQF